MEGWWGAERTPTPLAAMRDPSLVANKAKGSLDFFPHLAVTSHLFPDGAVSEKAS